MIQRHALALGHFSKQVGLPDAAVVQSETLRSVFDLLAQLLI